MEMDRDSWIAELLVSYHLYRLCIIIICTFCPRLVEWFDSNRRNSSTITVLETETSQTIMIDQLSLYAWVLDEIDKNRQKLR